MAASHIARNVACDTYTTHAFLMILVAPIWVLCSFASSLDGVDKSFLLVAVSLLFSYVIVHDWAGGFIRFNGNCTGRCMAIWVWRKGELWHALDEWLFVRRSNTQNAAKARQVFCWSVATQRATFCARTCVFYCCSPQMEHARCIVWIRLLHTFLAFSACLTMTHAIYEPVAPTKRQWFINAVFHSHRPHLLIAKSSKTHHFWLVFFWVLQFHNFVLDDNLKTR